VVAQPDEGLEDVKEPKRPGCPVEHGQQGVADEDALPLLQRGDAPAPLLDDTEVGRRHCNLRQERRRRCIGRSVGARLFDDSLDLERVERPTVKIVQLVQKGFRHFPLVRGDLRLYLFDARHFLIEPRLDESPFLLSLGNHAVLPDYRIRVGLVKPVLGASLFFAAAAEFGVGDRTDHVTHGPAVEEHLEAEFRETPAELDVLRAEAELLTEDPMPDKQGSLARRAAAPEVSVVQLLAVTEMLVGEEELPHVHDVMHHGGDIERRVPCRETQDRHVLSGVFAMRPQVLLQQVAVRHVVVVEEEENGGLCREDAEVFRRRDSRVGL